MSHSPIRKQRIVMINVSHPSIGSRIPKDHLPPLGLLCVAAPLIDQGYSVTLLDADRLGLNALETVSAALVEQPDIVMFGHSGSSTAHSIILTLSEHLKAARPEITIIYGGVHPSYFWYDTLTHHPAIDYIVRGEGEKTTLLLLEALHASASLETVPGIAYRNEKGLAVATALATMIDNLDDYRVAWELISFDDYHYYGGHKAVVIQFSRGCPHLCSYCGQNRFWTRWRHRDPVRFAREIAWLHRVHGVQVFNLADENCTTSKQVWKTFLEALIAENIPVKLVGSIRASDIVRDADILHLYKQAGFERLLLGIEHTSETTLQAIKKGSTTETDQQAIQLLRQHHIISLATWVAGFEEESPLNLWHTFKQLLAYDPDQIQLIHATPHRWTPFGKAISHRKLVQADPTKWDYKHQVLHTPYLKPWQLFFGMKAIELVMQIRPKALKRSYFHPDKKTRQGMRWYNRVGAKVWFHEIAQFLFHESRCKPLLSLQEYWGNSHIAQGNMLRKKTIQLEIAKDRRFACKKTITPPQKP